MRSMPTATVTPEITEVVLVIESSSAYGRGLLSGVAEYARLHGPWSFLIEPRMPTERVLRVRGSRLGGVILALNHLRRAGRSPVATRVPVVDLDCQPPHRFPRGICNNEPEVGRIGAQHLRACGLSHFAYCGVGPTDPASAFWEVPRARGFVDAVRAAGWNAHQYEWPRRARDQDWRREQAHLARWLTSLPKPVGVMAGNDHRALRVMEAARLAGISIPGELAVLGTDNDEMLCEMASPPLSSVVLNTGRVGYEAAALLDRLMKGQKKGYASPILVEPRGVVARRSSDVLAIGDEAVATAVRLIRTNIHTPLQVVDILKTVRISRRSLEMRFRRVLGWSPHDEIQRARVARVKDLLQQTDWPLKRISAGAGFTRPQHMHTVFRRETGMTPSRYRALHASGPPNPK